MRNLFNEIKEGIIFSTPVICFSALAIFGMAGLWVSVVSAVCAYKLFDAKDSKNQ